MFTFSRFNVFQICWQSIVLQSLFNHLVGKQKNVIPTNEKTVKVKPTNKSHTELLHSSKICLILFLLSH